MGAALRGSYLEGTWARFIAHRKNLRKREKERENMDFNPGSINNQLGLWLSAQLARVVILI